MKFHSEFADRGSWQTLKEDIRKHATDLKIDKVGFASAAPFLELKDRLQRHRRLGRESGFEEPDLDKRVEPKKSLQQAKSIIAIAVAYPSKLENAPRSEKAAYRGMISRSAWGGDYHHVLRERMQRLEDFLQERVEGLVVESMVDTGALADRAVAERAGIGWSGKNCSIITPEYGSWVYLAEMLTNLPLPPDQPITDSCGDCTLCIDACPTGALVGPGELNAQRCVSFVTQSKGMVEDEMKKKLGNRLYGCDTCQVVCPKNKQKNWTRHVELQPDPELVKPLLAPLLELSNKQFKKRYGHTAAAWRGKNPIQRNAIIALGHFKDVSALPRLFHLLLEDPRAMIREAAAWAIAEIQSGNAVALSLVEEAESVIGQAGQIEKDPNVIQALHKAQRKIEARLGKQSCTERISTHDRT